MNKQKTLMNVSNAVEVISAKNFAKLFCNNLSFILDAPLGTCSSRESLNIL